MSIKCLREYQLGSKLGQVRSVPVSLGNDREKAVLFVYSAQENLDPWHECVYGAKDTLKMALYTEDGILMWEKDMGEGVIPGVWYFPFISFDLDGDGIDEIWYVTNLNPNAPFSFIYRRLERLDPRTGKVTGQWMWPNYTVNETMSHAYRFFLSGGYVNGSPVLVTAQGTYTDMYLQGYNPGMEKRWEIVIPKDEPGARSSHLCPVLDFNEDGIDELFWGERLLSLDDGHEVFCGDREKYRGHSDIVTPFIDIETGKKYIYTCREGYEVPGEQRVVIYDAQGQKAWTAVDEGHMHKGWIANIGENYRKVIMSMRLDRKFTETGLSDEAGAVFYFDAVTGKELKDPIPFPGNEVMPLDFDGDGYHEFCGIEGDSKGYVFDRFGKILKFIGGEQVRSGKILSEPGEQIMLFYPHEGKVRVWGDDCAVESDVFRARYQNGYLEFMQHLMGTGYNHINGTVSCGI
ncbi:MAG: hypothetical protein ACOX6P_04755 [Candidatus Merdivicinus sp.]|jgi:hypothetical protein